MLIYVIFSGCRDVEQRVCFLLMALSSFFFVILSRASSGKWELVIEEP